jgi:hypothetical protein
MLKVLVFLEPIPSMILKSFAAAKLLIKHLTLYTQEHGTTVNKF